MRHFPRRHVFVDYESLTKIQFSKLEKVCSKVYIFISEDMEVLPVSIVLQAQKLGKRVKWITAEKDKGNGFILPISFLMGSLHEKLHHEVEFAILSNDEAFDTIVQFINDEGRNCLRVTTTPNNKNLENNTFLPQEELAIPTTSKTSHQINI